MNFIKVLKLLFLMFCLFCIYSGTTLVNHRYIHEKNIVYEWKTGNETTQKLEEHHQEQVVKTLIVHLGLIIFGVMFSTLLAVSLFSPCTRKSIDNKI